MEEINQVVLEAVFGNLRLSPCLKRKEFQLSISLLLLLLFFKQHSDWTSL